MRTITNVATTVAALGMSLAVAVSGTAEATDYAMNGYWANYYEAKGPICGMRTGSTPQGVHIKWFANDSQRGLVVQMFKDNWVIPNGKDVNIRVGFDKNLVGTAVATGSMLNATTGDHFGVLSFYIPTSMVESFIDGFREADKMWIDFPDGNETRWVANMTGSRAASMSFLKCIVSVPAPSQPFGKPQASQPFGAPPTTPPASASPPTSATPTTDRSI